MRLDSSASRAVDRLFEGEVDGEPGVHLLGVRLRVDAQGYLAIPAWRHSRSASAPLTGTGAVLRMTQVPLWSSWRML